jgi:hypothetical protein
MATIAPSFEYRLLAGRSRSDLERLLVRGEAPSVEALAATEYGGWNHPRRMAVLGIRKFIKGFFRTGSGEHYGYNTPARQDGLDHTWSAKPDDQRPKRFGFYRVAPVDPEGHDNRYLHALLLDYGRGGNPASDVSRLIRDYLVRAEPGSDDLLLGKAYVALGPTRLYSNFFVLQRIGPALRPPTAPPAAVEA